MQERKTRHLFRVTYWLKYTKCIFFFSFKLIRFLVGKPGEGLRMVPVSKVSESLKAKCKQGFSSSKIMVCYMLLWFHVISLVIITKILNEVQKSNPNPWGFKNANFWRIQQQEHSNEERKTWKKLWLFFFWGQFTHCK